MNAAITADKQEFKLLVVKTFEETRRQNAVKLDYSVDKGFSDVKLFIGLGFGFSVTILTVWASWNVKNILKIDILPGGHHTFIDDVNNQVGM